MLHSRDIEEGRRLHEAVLNAHQYDYVKPLGKGGFSTVYLVWSRQYEQYFAVKVSDLKGKDGFINTAEIDLLMNLSHPNIIKLYAHFRANNYLYMVLEYCEKGTLQNLIKAERLNINQILAYFAEVVSAVEACHEVGIAHRDIKPSNVLVDSYGRAKLADFGLGVTSEPDNLVRFAGCSLAFSPPEIFAYKAIDPFKSDIWSLGITLYYMITQELPWSIGSRQSLIVQIKQGIQFWNIKVPYPVRKLIMQMTTLIPSDRLTPGQILQAQVLQENDNQAQMAQLITPHQSVSSDVVIKYSTGTGVACQEASPTERKDMIKCFGTIGLSTVMKRRKSIISQMVKRGGQYKTGSVLEPIHTFRASKPTELSRLVGE